MQDNIHKNALPLLAKGITKAYEMVSPTMGTKGSNVVIAIKEHPYNQTTNDGATIIQKMHLADPIESIGLQFVKEAVERSNNNSGDGSTTTVVLLNAILQEAMKYL